MSTAEITPGLTTAKAPVSLSLPLRTIALWAVIVKMVNWCI